MEKLFRDGEKTKLFTLFTHTLHTWEFGSNHDASMHFTIIFRADLALNK